MAYLSFSPKYLIRGSVHLLMVAGLLTQASFVVGAPQEGKKYNEQTIADAKKIATEFANHCKEGQFQKATGSFDATMKRVMKAERLKQTWNLILARSGKLEGFGSLRTDQVQGYLRVFVFCKFKKTPLEMVVVFNPKKEIAGLSFAPPAKKAEYKLPLYANPKKYSEQEVTFGKDPWKLPGTLTIPKGQGPFPAVVLIHGSGAHSRDVAVGPNRVFKDIATGLASKGIAVLRFDKRTFHYKKEILKVKNPTINDESVSDALAAADFLKAQKQIDSKRIIVLGHSLGGYVIPRIAQFDQNKRISGYVIMAGNTRSVPTLIAEQVPYLLKLGGEITEEGKKRIRKIQEDLKITSSKKLLNQQDEESRIFGAPKSYWLDLHGYVPATVAKKHLKSPTLILQGERDYQVTVKDDLVGWKNAIGDRKSVTIKTYPKLNHLMMSGKGKPNPQEYQVAGNVEGKVIRDIAKWVKRSVK